MWQLSPLVRRMRVRGGLSWCEEGVVWENCDLDSIFLVEMRLSLYTFGVGKKPRNVNKEIEIILLFGGSGLNENNKRENKKWDLHPFWELVWNKWSNDIIDDIIVLPWSSGMFYEVPWHSFVVCQHCGWFWVKISSYDIICDIIGTVFRLVRYVVIMRS